MATIRTIITDSLNRLNANAQNAVATAEDIAVCQAALNPVIDSLSNSILNIHTITPQRFPLTSNKQSYTLGPEFDVNGNATGADWITVRPMRIETAVLLAFATYDTPESGDIGFNNGTLSPSLQIINYAQFSGLTVRKLTSTWPTCVYVDGGFPLRTLSFWPVPQTTLAVELWMWEPLSVYSDIDEDLNLPPGYERYFVLKLAVEVASTFGKKVSDTLKATLTEAESNVKTLNQVPAYSRPSQAGNALGHRTPNYVSGDNVTNRIPRTGGY